MSKKTITQFFDAIRKATTEEEVKHAYAKYFDISYNTADRMDLYTPGVLFEFKYDKNLKSLRIRSQVLAQALYYVKQLKYGVDTEKTIPPFLCLADVNEAVLTETVQWQTFSLGAKELKALKAVHDQLKDKLLPQIKEYGIIE